MNRKLVGISIESVLGIDVIRNHIPPTWPPQVDFPVIVDADGQPVSLYGDSIWDLTPWTNRKKTINFGDGLNRKDTAAVSLENANLFRQLVTMWLYGSNGVRTISTLTLRFDCIRLLMAHFTKIEILASQATGHPKLIEQLAKITRPCNRNLYLFLFHDIWDNRDLLGFYILNPDEISYFSNYCSRHDTKQTPYMPPRIWAYQAQRLKQFIDDFLENMEKICNCYEYMLLAYEQNGLSSTNRRFKRRQHPFRNHDKDRSPPQGITILGKFEVTLEKHDLIELMEKWLGNLSFLGPKAMGMYFLMATIVGCAYIASFSLMRLSEIRSLRLGCFAIERDERLGLDIPTIRGCTTKTLSDNNACWITSASTASAITMLEVIANLRTKLAIRLGAVLSPADTNNPYLITRAIEPWHSLHQYIDLPPSARPMLGSYNLVTVKFPKLFDKEELRINSNDLELAKLVTPSLNPEIFGVNSVWPIAWHQLRRTGAVNMNASGLVSEASLQYELKHTSPWMSRYYGQGFHHVNLEISDDVKAAYIKGMYEAIAIQFRLLELDRYISPHGDKRKTQILASIKSATHMEIVQAIEKGTISCRNILMGICTSSIPCPYGGIDYVAKCAGTDTKHSCENLLIDNSKRPIIETLAIALKDRLKDVPDKSPLKSSLELQLASVETYLNVTKR